MAIGDATRTKGTSSARPIDFALPDHAGGTYRLSDALRQGTVGVVFYRGDW
jgi:peroxiredoxin